MQRPGLILRGLVLRASLRYSVDFWATQNVGTFFFFSVRCWFRDLVEGFGRIIQNIEIVGSWNHSIWNPSQGLSN